MRDFIHIDDLIVRVIRSSSRNTLEIIIERDGELTLRIPEICSSEEASNFVKKKMHWIYAKLAQKELFQIPKGKKEIVNGEGFFS